MCPHPRRHVRWIRRPRECALFAVFIPPHSLLAFPLVALQSTLVVLESQAQHLSPRVCCLHCNRILYLAGAYFDDGNIDDARQSVPVNCWVIYSRSYEEDIPHKLKLIIRQYEANCLAAVEDMQSYTLVELTIIQLDSTTCPSARSCRWPVCHFPGRKISSKSWTISGWSLWDCRKHTECELEFCTEVWVILAELEKISFRNIWSLLNHILLTMNKSPL